MSKRNATIDLIKGISIISIVLGHALNTDIYYSQNVDFVRSFVYLFHLSTFFFTSGYTFKNYNFKNFLKKKFYSLYIPFVFFEFFSLILYPVWRYYNVIDTIPLVDFVVKIIWILLFIPSGIFEGAMWFVPSLFVALLAYYIITNLRINNWLKIILIIFISLVGYLSILYFGARIINRGFLMLPVVFLGDLSKKHNLLEFIKPRHFLFLFPLLLILNNYKYLEIEISKGLLANGWFYLISIIGIAFCVSLAKIIEKSSSVMNIINVLSVNSFYIMALHFIIFKFIDVVYSNVIDNYDLIKEYPISYSELRPVYFILGISLSILLGLILKPILTKIKNKIQTYI